MNPREIHYEKRAAVGSNLGASWFSKEENTVDETELTLETLR